MVAQDAIPRSVYQHAIWVPVCAPAGPLLIQLAAYGMKRQQRMVQVPGFLRPHWRPGQSSWLQISSVHSGCHGHVLSEPADGRLIFISLSLRPPLSSLVNLSFKSK